jgi:hypothetical protein
MSTDGKRSSVVSNEEETRMTMTGNRPAQSYSRIDYPSYLA